MDNLPTGQDTLDTKNLLSPNSLMTPDPNKVGQSVFYDCIDASPCVEVADKIKVRNDTDEEGDSKYNKKIWSPKTFITTKTFCSVRH